MCTLHKTGCLSCKASFGFSSFDWILHGDTFKLKAKLWHVNPKEQTCKQKCSHNTLQIKITPQSGTMSTKFKCRSKHLLSFKCRPIVCWFCMSECMCNNVLNWVDHIKELAVTSYLERSPLAYIVESCVLGEGKPQVESCFCWIRLQNYHCLQWDKVSPQNPRFLKDTLDKHSLCEWYHVQ